MLRPSTCCDTEYSQNFVKFNKMTNINVKDSLDCMSRDLIDSLMGGVKCEITLEYE
jgi:hypothetical protein